MKKILTITILMVLVLTLGATMVKATTQSELEEYLLSTFTVAGKTVSLTEANKNRVQRYLSQNTITDEQATAIKAKVEEAIAFMNSKGVYEVTDLSTADKKEILSIAQEGLAIIGLTATYNTSDGSIEIYKNGTLIEAVGKDPAKLVQTGTTNYVYILAGVAIIAVAATVVIKKVKTNE